MKIWILGTIMIIIFTACTSDILYPRGTGLEWYDNKYNKIEETK